TEHEELETRRHRTGQQARHVYNYPREGTGHGDSTARSHGVEQRSRNATNQARQEVTVEDIDEVDDDDDDDSGDECEHHTNGMQPHAGTTVSQQDTKEESPGFTAYVKKRLTSMDEVIKDLEEQFMTICSAANEVSALLEFGRAQYSSPSSELSAMKMLNPVALFQSASSRSSSSRFFWNSSSSRDESSDSSSSDFYEESSMVSGSHQSTVGKLFAWEKRLRRSPGEKIRLAYEKVCNQLKSQDVKGDDPSAVDKTRAAIRDLHTQIKVSIRSIEAVSKRIEAVRDKELQPQISELVLGDASIRIVISEPCWLSRCPSDRDAGRLAAEAAVSEGRHRAIELKTGEIQLDLIKAGSIDQQIKECLCDCLWPVKDPPSYKSSFHDYVQDINNFFDLTLIPLESMVY
ncbi:ROLLING AND ERECT LEAF 2-like protein, partial [Drosera capensis]